MTSLPLFQTSRRSRVSELFHPVGGLEILGKGFVHACDDFVDGLLPRGFHILLGEHRAEKLSKCGFNYTAERLGCLWKQKKKLL